MSEKSSKKSKISFKCENNKKENGQTCGKVLIVFVIILGGHYSSVAASIRYGFLAIYFGKREISGRMFGFVEGSIFFGYLGSFLCRNYWYWMAEKITPKWGIVIMFSVQALASAITGLADITDNNTIFLIFSTIPRVLGGFSAFPHNVYCLDLLKTIFPSKFDLMTGLMQMAYFSGHGIGEFVGTCLYGAFGYKVPFIFTTTCLVCVVICSTFVLPPCPSIALSDQVKDSNDKQPFDNDGSRQNGITSLIIFPMCACMLINCIYAYLQISCTPYLYEKFNIPLSVGGTVLLTVSAGVAIGSSLSGMIAQSGRCNTYKQMATGAGMVGIGLLLMFPSRSISFLYNNVPYIAYPAVMLSGIGDPIITIPTLRAITDLQTLIKGKCTGKNSISIFGIWMMSSTCSNYSGALVGGVMMEYLSYQHGAYILVSFCCVSIVTSLVMLMAVNNFKGKATDEDNEDTKEKNSSSPYGSIHK